MRGEPTRCRADRMRRAQGNCETAPGAATRSGSRHARRARCSTPAQASRCIALRQRCNGRRSRLTSHPRVSSYGRSAEATTVPPRYRRPTPRVGRTFAVTQTTTRRDRHRGGGRPRRGVRRHRGRRCHRRSDGPRDDHRAPDDDSDRDAHGPSNHLAGCAMTPGRGDAVTRIARRTPHDAQATSVRRW